MSFWYYFNYCCMLLWCKTFRYFRWVQSCSLLFVSSQNKLILTVRKLERIGIGIEMILQMRLSKFKLIMSQHPLDKPSLWRSGSSAKVSHSFMLMDEILPFVIFKWHLVSTSNKYLNSYTKRWCTKYKLLLTSSDIST